MGKLLNRNVVILSLVILYRVLLDYTYVNITNPVWAYAGFNNNATLHSQLASWIVLIVLTCMVLPYFKSTDSFYPDLLVLFFVMRVVPFTTIIRFINTPDSLSIWFVVYGSLIFILTKIIKLRPVPLNVKGISRSNDMVIYLGLIFFAAVIVFISGYYTHFRIHLSFNDVYDLRHDASDFSLPTIMRYAWSPATNILPLFFVYFFRERKKVVCLLIVFLIVLNFSINGLKSTIFKLLICVILSIINMRNFKPYYLIALVIVLVFTIAETHVWGLRVFHDLVVRRVLFVPTLLDTYYYDYITLNGPMYYMRGGTPIQYIISEIYTGDPNMESNNGFFSDAFMNLGVFGCVVYPLIYAFVFRLWGSAFRGAENGLVIFAAFTICFTMFSSEFTTSLLTHGLFLFSVFMYLISIKSYKKNNCIKTTNYAN